MPVTHLAMAFALARPGVTSAPLGPRAGEQLADLLTDCEVTLTDEILDELDAIVRPARPWTRPTGPPTCRRTDRDLTAS